MSILRAPRMVKMLCLIHKDYVEQMVTALGELRIIHFTQPQLASSIKPEVSGDVRERLQEISFLLSEMNAVFGRLGLRQRGLKRFRVEWEETSSLVGEMKAYLEEVMRKIGEIDADAQALEGDVAISSPRLRLRRKGLKMRLHNLAKESDERLQQLHVRLKAKMNVYETLEDLPHTKRVYFFEGWVPKKRVKEFHDCLRSVSRGFGVVLSEIEAEPYPEKATGRLGKPPTLLRYPRVTGIFGNFNAITRAFGVPDYYEIEPTAFFLLSFPLIFGMMYGDVGHGSVLFAGAALLYLFRDRFTFSRTSIFNYVFDGLPLIMLCAVSSTVFGFLYGEVFGSEEWFTSLTGLHKALWFSPMSNPNTMLRYALYVGIIHVSSGLLLDLMNKVARREFEEAVLGPGLWLWFYLSSTSLVVTRGWDVIDVMYEPDTMGLFVLLPFGVMLLGSIRLEGYMGVTKALEALLTSFSHTVSYARILALKIIGTSFSLLILPNSTLGFIPFFIGTLFLITIFETLLVFLHTLRLHWIEWFSKFYRGSGLQFRPFTLIE